ncbi:flagellar biosynthetic protein FliO [Cellulomonas hominis]
MDTAVVALRVLVALLVVVGLIWLAARRLGAGRRTPDGPSVQVIGRQALGRHAGVAVVAVGNRRLLLGYGEQQVTMLTELGPAGPAEATPRPARGSVGRALSSVATLPLRGSAVPVDSAPGAPPGTMPLDPLPLGAAVADLDVAVVAAALVPDPAEVALGATVGTARPGPLDGSVLSPATWRRALVALQDRTVRR